ncbi:hypothetical protein R69927_01645 [Paraburkholderia domus]|jgi:hypothetical protein|uniref:Uncharacterized protein n=2 Tax=Paraburkholderia domus TaxID=2793075 RepID=A0A9N8MTU8_9BURK|nr:hypothetical protein [Paraburkholderia domus]CAE6686520.1 hypothetical protein R75483_00115 [Paraburkholderia domus]CAE6700094.1 hypothetical protein R70006_00683 [Paraburkholderia domus]CAE6842349.1 hypothetical protein R69927_01645 [Paraburkholderia domus]CAE6876296.1 hypothetical protein R70199_02151 [Paraburkholderia domus]CAE6878353.1 hypothetical protein R69749_06875 [Paraburkholderia domus]
MAALLFASATAIAVAVEVNAWKSAADGSSASATLEPAVDNDTGALRLPLGHLEAALASARLQLFTVTDRPGLYVMQAASLAQQGAMFARVVALLERRDMPRNRVVSAAAIAAHARRFGTDPAGLTAGNNFSTVELTHFFEVAREQGVVLNQDERVLQTILVRWRLIRQEQGIWKAVSARDFLITIPGLGPAPGGEMIDATVRAAILSHELGHWQYFSDSAYAHACRVFWWQVLSYEERAELTRQLANLGYDPSDRIVIDEMQAYLLHTPAAYMPIVDTPGAGGIDVGKVRRRLEQSVARGPQ